MKRHILILIIAFLAFWSREAAAFWGSDTKESASGLDVASGFDVNTITTITGTVLTLPARKGEGQHTQMTVAATQGTVTVVLGPWAYWEKQTIIIAAKQELSITGSFAQGKDGALYLFVQRILNVSNGETVTLRTDSGKPLWSRSGSGNQNGINQKRGSGQRFDAGGRGGAGGGGGGMRGGGGR